MNSANQEAFLAHSKNKQGNSHSAKDHLFEVARLASVFAAGMPWHGEAALAGLLHDLGKYGDLFKARLQGEEKGIDHWSAGAWVALSEYQAIAAALAIQGHHIGLQQGVNSSLRNMKQPHPANTRLSEVDFTKLKQRFAADSLALNKPETSVIPINTGFHHQISSMLDVRMLFSCLTDADFLDTEAHFEGRTRKEGPSLDPDSALKALHDFMETRIRTASQADMSVLEARNSLWEMITSAAQQDTGLLTLTAPTGSGKTLAMLKFALEHIIYNKAAGLKRIILVVPFLSIIEQTAAIYRKIFNAFPENFVLEHHSMAGMGIEESSGDAEEAVQRERRLLAENWDAPIIITTNVQLLESLFSNRPSVCRKLHNLMQSVIMFDEAQTLPQHLAVPTLVALSHLSASYKTSVLFATATQPAFDFLHESVAAKVPTGWLPVEAAPEHGRLYDKLRRYDVVWPKDNEQKSWRELADEVRARDQVLCIVNLKSHAAQLLEELRHVDGVFHLSTNLCAVHRQTVLNEVRERLKAGKRCRLISTQCIEAGVDVDFPVVYRALAPLDAIAQAAGRCNREGRLLDENGVRTVGVVIVFEPEPCGNSCPYPTKAYFQAAEITRSMLIEAGDAGLDLNDPEVYRAYYRRLYGISRPEMQNRALNDAITAIDFVRVAAEYRLIEKAAIQVLMPYSAEQELYDELRCQQDTEGISTKWIRLAQRLAVSVYRPQGGHPNLIPARLRFGKGVSDEWFILQETEECRYDDVMGLVLPKSQQIFIA